MAGAQSEVLTPADLVELIAAVAKGEYRYDPAIGETTLRENMDIIARWHGHDGGRLRGFLAPHAPDTCSRELLREVAKLADRSGPPVHTHLAQVPIVAVVGATGRRPGTARGHPVRVRRS